MITIAGRDFARPPQSVEDVIQLTAQVMPALLRHLSTEQDFYWFVIEQYDRLYGYHDTLDEMLETIGLLEIEYEGQRSETSYIGKPNPGIVFVEDQIRKPLSRELDEGAMHFVLVGILTAVASSSAVKLLEIRRKHATHYHNNCIEKGHFNMADKWVEVLDAIDKQ
ncbi:hypothetical protein N2600_02470 [Rhizobium sp. WSM1274]|uniref:hypothetical protein n=1 Tax=Rhizobium sp. WSM1274 TaxID=3138254 RepID=UPI0021A74FC6|nr:hypothetical protein [Rhizobium leguminosarum]UWU28856.1 hypothetical protein N2600_02470 [Rhizobium leguminosarum bv. viciae]